MSGGAQPEGEGGGCQEDPRAESGDGVGATEDDDGDEGEKEKEEGDQGEGDGGVVASAEYFSSVQFC